MAVTAKMFAKAPLSFMSKTANLSSDTIKIALFTNALTPVQASNQYFDASPYTSNQVAAANGYSTGGNTLASVTLATSSLTTTLDAADTSWTVTSTGFTYRYAIIYDDSPASSKPLVAYIDFGADVTASAGTHTIVFDAAGIATVTVA